jgi:hypothetical protein
MKTPAFRLSSIRRMKTRLLAIPHLRSAGFAITAVAVASAALVVTASAAGMRFGFGSSPAPGSNADLATLQASTGSAACQDFVQHFATDLGKTQAQVNAAFQKAIADTLADEVKNGKLTQAQADAIKKRLANMPPCAAAGAIARPGAVRRAALGAFLQQYLKASASALGITPDQLRSDLKAGQSLSQIAASRNISESDFRTRLAANLKPVLDQAVAAKKITAAQEQRLLDRLKTGQLPLWTRAPRPSRPAATPAPSPSTTTT